VIVVKVGGSLYNHPGLGPGLRAYLAELAPEPVLLVPGGGDFGDAVRKLDSVHQLGEEAAHRLALKSLAAPAAFLSELLSRPLPPAPSPAGGGGATLPLPPRGRGPGGGVSFHVLDADDFCRQDGELPHSWAVTTDSIAARAAVVYRAARLVLLKSIDIPPGNPWPEAAERGWVDPYFPHVVAGRGILIEPVNFRRRLGSPGSDCPPIPAGVYSTHPMGTPRDHDADRPSVSATDLVHAPLGGAGRVLVVEADPDAAASTAALFRLHNFDARTAPTAAAALAALAAHRPAVVVLDLDLPDADGCDLIRRLRAAPRPPAVVVVTGHTDAAHRRAAAAAGAAEYLLKPADPDTLVGLLRRYCGTDAD
jgi:CheY-like chemotaxis protein